MKGIYGDFWRGIFEEKINLIFSFGGKGNFDEMRLIDMNFDSMNNSLDGFFIGLFIDCFDISDEVFNFFMNEIRVYYIMVVKG